MLLSKAKNMISSKINRHGAEYSSGTKRFKGILMKSNISQDLPRAQFVVYAGHDADYEDGEIISKAFEYYIPLQIETPSFVDGDMYNKLFVMRANASGDLYHYDYPAIASFDAWDVATASTGYIKKKTSVHVCFERISLRADVEEPGQVESADFFIIIPWAVNASFTPIAECRFTDRQDRNWKIEDVDDKTHFNQAYVLRVSPDDR